MEYRLPRAFRPRSNAPYRQFRPGADLPAGFFDDIRSIDDRLHIVWHHFKTETDPVMNEYEGEIDDPRFHIHEQHGEEVWGWVLRNGDDSPVLENMWHIWELHQHGWSHVCPVLSSDPRYLSILAKKLHRQTNIITKYGAGRYVRMLRAKEEELKEEEKKDLAELNNAVMEENGWFLNAAMENLSRGVVAATNPSKEIISSYAGQGNKSKIVRPISDTEGGLYLPDQWKN